MVNIDVLRESITYTSSQCLDNWLPLIIILTIAMSIFFISFMFSAKKEGNYLGFIKENKLEQKFKDWKELNKGL
jgi:hypothetical protein